MSFTENQILAKHVEARNLVNAKSIEVSKRFCELLEKYQGAKVVKTTPYRAWVKKIEDQVSIIQDELQREKFRLVFTFSEYTVWGMLDRAFSVSDDYVKYVKSDIHICSLHESCFLKSIPYDSYDYRINYTVDEILSARSQISDLQDKIRSLKSLITEFN